MEEILKLKLAHLKRLEERTGYGKREPHPRGIEEKVSVDGGPPLTLVINPQHWDYTDRAKRVRERQASREKPAMTPDPSESSIERGEVD